MIELTDDQVRALRLPREAPLRFLNPQTQETYVLIALTEYERLGENKEYDDGPWTDAERELLRLEACQLLESFGKDA